MSCRYGTKVSLTISNVFPPRKPKRWPYRLAWEEGLFCGVSTGGNVVAAIRLAERLGPNATIVTLMCDTGMKYLKTFAQDMGSPND